MTCWAATEISDEFGVIRHIMNMEVVNTLEGTHDIHAPRPRPRANGYLGVRGLRLAGGPNGSSSNDPPNEKGGPQAAFP